MVDCELHCRPGFVGHAAEGYCRMYFIDKIHTTPTMISIYIVADKNIAKRKKLKLKALYLIGRQLATHLHVRIQGPILRF